MTRLGSGAFDHDDAAGWVGGLAGGGVGELRSAFSVADGDGPVGAREAAVAVAAAEVVAAMNGAPADDLPESVRAFAAAVPPPEPELIVAARAALDRVTGEGSELARRWDENADPDAATRWRAGLSDLRDRLGRG